MLHLEFSTRLDQLVHRFITCACPAGLSGTNVLFSDRILIVPNPQIATYLKFAIAKSTGIAVGLEFEYLDSFLARRLQLGQHPANLLSRELCHGLILDLLSESELLRRRGFESVHSYLNATQIPDAQELRRFQLAGKLATVFEHYIYSRVEMLQSWQKPSAAEPNGDESDVECWQRQLWLRVFGPGGELDTLRARGGLRHVSLLELPAMLADPAVELPAELHLFAFSYMANAYLKILGALSRRTHVFLYTFVPARTMFAALDGNLEFASSNRAIELWGRPGLEYFQHLGQLAREDSNEPYKELSKLSKCVGVIPESAGEGPRDSDSDTGRGHGKEASILSLLREYVVEGKAPPRKGRRRIVSHDTSLKILKCPGIQREAEVIANKIWNLIENDNAAHQRDPRSLKLRFNDIAVVIADGVHSEEYQTHLRYAFGELHEIPFNLIDVSALRDCRLLEALQQLLSLPFGNLSRPEVLGLLTHPAVQTRFPGSGPDEWAAWCDSLAIFHGADHNDHAESYIQKDLINWDQGLKRLAAGAFLAGGMEAGPRTVAIGGSSYLPLCFPQSSLANAARFITIVRSMLSDVGFAKTARLTLADWSTFMTQMVSSYLAADTLEDERALSRALKTLGGLADLDATGRPVSYRIAYEFARQALAGLSAARGQYLADGVVVSSFLPMRALPFRVVIICGLGAGCFPAQNSEDALDLTHVTRLPGDVQPRERDKYLFLETLAATREQLCLSYVALDTQTGEALEPSPLIHELRLVLSEIVSPEAMASLEEVHPLRRYDPAYFPEAGIKPSLTNYSSEAFFEAHAVRLGRRARDESSPAAVELSLAALRTQAPGLAGWTNLCPLPPHRSWGTDRPVLSLSISAIRKFLECPMQGWARVCLGMREEDDEGIHEQEHEAFSLVEPSMSTFLREAMTRVLTESRQQSSDSAIEQTYDSMADAAEMAGWFPTGFFRTASKQEHLATLKTWYEQLGQAGLLERGPFGVYRLGRGTTRSSSAAAGPPLRLEIAPPYDATEQPPLTVEIHGQTELLIRDLNATITFVRRKEAHEKHFLRGYLNHLVLSAARPDFRTQFEAHVISESVENRRFIELPADQALAHLRALIIDLLHRSHAYLLPFEAVCEYVRDPDKSLGDIVLGLLEENRPSFSSIYGPVPLAHVELLPPHDDEAVKFIDRRFGLFFRGLQEKT